MAFHSMGVRKDRTTSAGPPEVDIICTSQLCRCSSLAEERRWRWDVWNMSRRVAVWSSMRILWTMCRHWEGETGRGSRHGDRVWTRAILPINNKDKMRKEGIQTGQGDQNSQEAEMSPTW